MINSNHGFQCPWIRLKWLKKDEASIWKAQKQKGVCERVLTKSSYEPAEFLSLINTQEEEKNQKVQLHIVWQQGKEVF